MSVSFLSGFPYTIVNYTVNNFSKLVSGCKSYGSYVWVQSVEEILWMLMFRFFRVLVEELNSLTTALSAAPRLTKQFRGWDTAPYGILSLSVAVIRHVVSGLSVHDVLSLRTCEKMLLLSVFLSPDDSHHHYDSSLLQHLPAATIVLKS